jgi:hypothetical protein
LTALAKVRFAWTVFVLVLERAVLVERLARLVDALGLDQGRRAKGQGLRSSAVGFLPSAKAAPMPPVQLPANAAMKFRRRIDISHHAAAGALPDRSCKGIQKL